MAMITIPCPFDLSKIRPFASYWSGDLQFRQQDLEDFLDTFWKLFVVFTGPADKIYSPHYLLNIPISDI